MSCLALFQLASCAQTMSAPLPSKPIPAPVYVAVCVPMRDYTADEQLKLAAAVEALKQGDPLIAAMADYGQLRAEVRACQGARRQ